MNIGNLLLTASIAGMLAAGPVGLAQANDAHHPADSATKQVQPKPKKKITVKRNQAAISGQHGQMAMGGTMKNSPMMQGGQAGQGGMMQGGMTQGGMMKSPMMSADGSSMPFHSFRMQWHHTMMMWHHQMMHGQPPMYRGG